MNGEAPSERRPQHRELFDALYREHFDFVFRNLRRLGIPDASLDDAVQDAFLVVLRRIGELRPGTQPKAWLFAILIRVAQNHRRSQRRRGFPAVLSEERIASPGAGPFDRTADSQARQTLHAFLERLEDHRRAAFVMAELEQMTAPEIAEAMSAKLNTVYSWLRLARIEFVRMLDELREKDGSRRG